MKAIGALLLTAGFLWGAWIAVLTDRNEIDWVRIAPGLVIAAIGVAMMRVGASRAESEGDGRLPIGELTELLAKIADGAQRLDAEKQAIDVYELPDTIDQRFAEDLADFADSRKSIIASYGLESYAEVMNDFAAGERYLNRVWSCSIDGYIDEAHTYLTRAGEQFVAASTRLSGLKK